ncbi:unnamed protein product [Toxocara canis]|uniref:Ig-like domain-containing protein n=1 Tax=Toxocara canis TaxID=6265 RepID=A0A3P7IJG5_TOXCA|nr:unnamed protein product [Toxocara canis]
MAGNPKPKVIWYRGGREVPSYRYIQIEGGRLTIQGVQDSDAGSYTCVAQNIAGRDFGNINLDVGSLPTIVPTPETIRVNIERSITLQCRAIGHPIPKITWHRHGIPIAKMGSRVKILPDGSLLINNAQTDDQDRYTCTAKNIFGQQDKTTMLMVTGLISPVLGHVPPEEQLVEGKDLRLSCVVVLGTPKPTLKWFKDGLPLQPSDTVIIEGGGSGVLLRRGNPRDEGRYTCAAISPAGNATLNVNVQLIRKPIIEDTGVQDFVVSLGESIDIPCKVSGKPPPKITWSLDGKPLAAIGHEYTVLADNTLRIHRANNNHIGKYVCTASNAAGESEHAASLNVLSAPIIAPGQISYNLIQGNSITLPCEVKGEPQPKITWYLNEEIFTEGIVNQDGSLTIPSADELHRGHFKCVAENEVGIDERIVILTVHTAPTIEGSGQVKTIVVNVNETAVLPCPARAQPPPTRAWSYEGDRLYPGYTHGSEIRFTSDGSIEVVTPQMNHAGKYTCHVSNLAGDDHITYLLKVQEPPIIISEIPGTIDVVLGLMLEIPCRAIGSPDPTVTWEKDGFQIIPDDIVEIDPSGTLRIEKTQLAHRGEYRCLAANPAGKDLRNTLVVVQEPPVILPTTLSDYTTVEGDRIELRCFAKANPPPVITWSRKGVPITDETIGMHVTDAIIQITGCLMVALINMLSEDVLLSDHCDKRRSITLPSKYCASDGTLIIDSVENDDAGHYTCKASNAAGDTDKIIRLSVIIPPDIPDPHTIITETVVAGQPFSLYCPVFSTPLPQITWHLDDRPIAEGDPNIHLSDDKRRLHILRSRTTDAGSYKCVARNPAGESSKTFHVEVLVPPNLDESTHKLKLSVLENGRIEIGCPVSGIPSPDISWLANGQLLEEGRGKRGVILAPGGLSVLIESAQLYHEGIYTCVAANKAGSLDIDVQLTVLGMFIYLKVITH